jgi:hypothetical protein
MVKRLGLKGGEGDCVHLKGTGMGISAGIVAQKQTGAKSGSISEDRSDKLSHERGFSPQVTGNLSKLSTWAAVGVV